MVFPFMFPVLSLVERKASVPPRPSIRVTDFLPPDDSIIPLLAQLPTLRQRHRTKTNTKAKTKAKTKTKTKTNTKSIRVTDFLPPDDSVIPLLTQLPPLLAFPRKKPKDVKRLIWFLQH